MGGNASERDVLVDPKGGRVLVVDRTLPSFEADAGIARVTVKLQGDGLKVNGLDCDRWLGLDADAGK
jgi:hypothetical protein